MANGEREKVVKAVLPYIIEALKGWWKRRQERKEAQKAPDKVEP
jgi:hypothetical protein